MVKVATYKARPQIVNAYFGDVNTVDNNLAVRWIGLFEQYERDG